MQYEEFVGRAEDRLHSPRPGEAEQAIVATFDTLGERISGGEASDIAEQLPEELAEPLRRAVMPNVSASMPSSGASPRRRTPILEGHRTRLGGYGGIGASRNRRRTAGRAQLPQEFYPLLQG